MKGGLLRGLATFLILTELAEGPKCGYEVSKGLSSRLGKELPPGYIYVMLDQLRRKGLVKVMEEGGSRRKKLYSITDEGLQFLVEHEEHIDRLMVLLQDVRRSIENLRLSGKVPASVAFEASANKG